MIQLTKLNHSAVVLNSDLIKLIEHSPDTVITLTNGEKILVEESAEEVMRRVVQFRRSVREDLYLRPSDPGHNLNALSDSVASTGKSEG